MTYWHWTYKKKYLWNLVQVPVVLALIVWILLSDKISLFLSIAFITVLVAVTLASLLYTYRKMKKEVKLNE